MIKHHMIRYSVSALLVLAATGCQEKAQAPNVAAPPVEPDRLRADESLPGTRYVFGVEVPRELRVVDDFGDRATLAGPMPLNAAIAYFSQQIEAVPIEVTGERALFARVRFKTDDRRREFRIDVVRQRRETLVQIADITPPPVTQGLDEQARWRQAGRNADGSPLDPRQAY